MYNLVHATIEKRIYIGAPIFNFNLGHSGIYIALVTTDGKVIVHNVQEGQTLGSFYFNFKVNHAMFCELLKHAIEKGKACVNSG